MRLSVISIVIILNTQALYAQPQEYEKFLKQNEQIKSQEYDKIDTAQDETTNTYTISYKSELIHTDKATGLETYEDEKIIIYRGDKPVGIRCLSFSVKEIKQTSTSETRQIVVKSIDKNNTFFFNDKLEKVFGMKYE